jgi:DNA helicase HerA-like ATPase
MYSDGKIYMGIADGKRICMEPAMANRHGLIAGATGTGKTITMKAMAESFSDAGVPVFLCDVKGDVSGFAEPGASNPGMEKRIDKFGIRNEFEYKAYPTCFWDVYQKAGHPIRATVSDMGPEIIARLLGLSEIQEGVLNIVFKIADDKGLILTDLKDLKITLNYVAEHRSEYTLTYGNMTAQSLGAVIRALIPLENQGGDLFFGEPDLDIHDWIRTDENGKGYVNIMNCTDLVQNPKLYAAFMLWMMAELFEELPEAGDMDKPKIVFFFDEAHLLFNDAPKVLVQKIEQLVKLIRSKGVGIYFVTQSPSDIPDPVLAQLSNRVQHALRAYTPAEQKAVRAAARAFRVNPAFDSEQVLLELGVGEALTSFLDAKGVPQMVERTAIICPQSLMAACSPKSRKISMAIDDMDKYDKAVDEVSAYEALTKHFEEEKKKAEEAAAEEQKAKEEAARKKEEEKEKAKKEKEKAAEQAKKEKKSERRKAQIERSLISTGMSVLKRGLFKTVLKNLI